LSGEDRRLGSVLGNRYRVDELIGRGGMSTVYLGFDIQLRRRVAIKIFQHGDDEDELRWQSEIHLLSRLSHPYLVTLHDAHLEPAGGDGASYLVMEYVPGSTLQHHLAQNGPSGTLAALVISQIGEALAAVHSHDVIHRDLKPGNILIEPIDVPPLHLRTKLADFGIAHLLGSNRLTRTGTTIGTAAYLSPEQVNGEPPTTASDIYSLGLVAIECATGRPAFSGTASESLIARLTRDPEIPDGLPAPWAALLTEMTARNPAHRPTALDAAIRARDIAPLLTDVRAPSSQTAAVSQVTERMLPPTLVFPGPAAAPIPTLATTVLTETNTARSGSGGRPRRFPRRLIIALLALAAAALIAVAALTQLLTGNLSPPQPSPPLTRQTATTISPTPTPTSTPTITAPVTNPGPGHGNGKKNHG
jgi:serine/threonine protein kinase